MKRLLLAVALLLMAGSVAAQQPDRLLPQKKRITDEALARDRALIQTWQARADSLPATSADAYARARAIALLAFVGSEYDRANRSPVLDSSFVQAVAIVERLGSGQTWFEAVAEPAGVELVAPGLWARLDSLQGADVNRCAQAEIARAQVKLLLAVQEHYTGGVACSAPVVAEVEALIEEVKRLIAACAPRVADTVTAIPDPSVIAREPEVAAPDTVKVPGQVHFAFDRARLSKPTRRILDSVAAQLLALPDAQIQLDAFTDPVGKASYNRRLSARRGDAVRRYLVSKGVDPARITVVPLGISAPLKQGVTLRERYALERRVDIQVTSRPNIVIERYAERGDLQPTPERRRARPRGVRPAPTSAQPR